MTTIVQISAPTKLATPTNLVASSDCTTKDAVLMSTTMLTELLIDNSSSTNTQAESGAIPLRVAYPNVWAQVDLLLKDLEKDRMEELARSGNDKSDLSVSY